MKNVALLIVSVFMLCSCVHSRDIQKEIADELQPAALRRAFSVQPENLNEKSQCQDKSINIVNIETDKTEFNMLQSRGIYMVSHYFFSNQITEYLKDAYRQSRIPYSSEASKTLQISVQKVEGYYGHVCWTTIRATVTIPGKSTVAIPFSSRQTALDVHWAAAYAIHDLSWQIVNDPTIQDYILCR